MGLAPDDIIRVTWRASVYAQEIQFQQNYRVLTTDGATAPLTSLFIIASYFSNDVTFGGPSALTNAFLGMLGNTVQQYRVDAQRILPTKTIYISKEAALNGTGGTGPKQTNTCAVFTLVSALPGRKQRATYHIGPLPDSFATQGSLSTPALTALRALAAAAQATQTLTMVLPGDCTLKPIILHRSPTAVPRWNDVASSRINFQVRTQRRRTIGVGK